MSLDLAVCEDLLPNSQVIKHYTYGGHLIKKAVNGFMNALNATS